MEGNYQRYPNKNNDLGCLKPARLGRRRTENRFGFVPALRNENNETKKLLFRSETVLERKAREIFSSQEGLGLVPSDCSVFPSAHGISSPKAHRLFAFSLSGWCFLSLTRHFILLSLTYKLTICGMKHVSWVRSHQRHRTFRPNRKKKKKTVEPSFRIAC